MHAHGAASPGSADGVSSGRSSAGRSGEGAASAAGPSFRWGAQPQNWTTYQEAAVRPLYEAVFDRLGLTAGTRLLDVGCGAGLAAQLAVSRGARVWGLDASAVMLEIARSRVPEGEALRARGLKVTRLARGVPAGSELEYVDLGTIAHALVDRR